jgi:uncharacterized protein GlcG (DUF336 family)
VSIVSLKSNVATSIIGVVTEGVTPISIAVVDETGVLIAFCRMDGAPRFSADFAIAKAKTAAAFGTETSSLEALYADRPVFAQSFVAQGGYFLGRGGVPIISQGEVIGAVGVSGSDSHGEEDIARAAVHLALGA